VRIIAGKYRGQQLVSFNADHIRPTTDRVKETLFNIWMGEYEDTRVLDLFCGTGNLGIEALSRGAAHVTFVEKHPQSLDITRRNLEKLKVTEDYHLQKDEVLGYLERYNGPPFHLVFVDPPFTKKMAHDVMLALAKSRVFDAETLISIESSSTERMDTDYDPLYRYSRREFGDKILSLFRVKTQPH
jgi:16S rRNA (guanine966-N2)-methyltransferase